jgi:hypothetical protein
MPHYLPAIIPAKVMAKLTGNYTNAGRTEYI